MGIAKEQDDYIATEVVQGSQISIEISQLKCASKGQS
jgi:hypothetical protein